MNTNKGIESNSTVVLNNTCNNIDGDCTPPLDIPLEILIEKSEVEKNMEVYHIFPSHEYIFLIDFILYFCRFGWFILVWR
jgi:hypothetical protein